MKRRDIGCFPQCLVLSKLWPKELNLSVHFCFQTGKSNGPWTCSPTENKGEKWDRIYESFSGTEGRQDTQDHDLWDGNHRTQEPRALLLVLHREVRWVRWVVFLSWDCTDPSSRKQKQLEFLWQGPGEEVAPQEDVRVGAKRSVWGLGGWSGVKTSEKPHLSTGTAP